MHTRPNLLLDRRFSPIFWTQFFGAFNDNIFKNGLVIFITIKAFSIDGIKSNQMVALCGGIFILPFFLFSATAGQLADKVSKSKLIVWIKIWEIIVMAIGAYGFISENVELLLLTLFFMGLHSAFFGPVKYSILPQLLHNSELVSGNAYVEMGTFLAILLGTILGGSLIALSQHGPFLISAAVLTVAILGWGSSLKIVSLGPVDPSVKLRGNPFPVTWEIVMRIAELPSVFQSILGISWFWFFGAAILSILPAYCKDFLHGEELLITLFRALFSVGIGIGSILCGRLSAGKLELGLVPLGSMGISLFAFDLFLSGNPYALQVASPEQVTVLQMFTTIGGWRIIMDLLFLAIFGGFFIVPLYTLIQQRSKEAERSRVIAGNNILNALSMVVAALLLVFLFHIGLSIPQIFLLLALFNLAVAICIFTSTPEFPFRFLCWIIANLYYRLKIVGRENLPPSGPALLLTNLRSKTECLIIASATSRPIRFMADDGAVQLPLAARVFGDGKDIPIAGSRENLQSLKPTLERIATELLEGQLVCICLERKGTQDGESSPFQIAIEEIIRETQTPVIPVALNGLTEPIFPANNRNSGRRTRRRFWSRVTLVIGSALSPEDASAHGTRN